MTLGAEQIGNLSAVGLAKEAVFNTPVTATSFAPNTQCSMAAEPGLFYPQTMMGIRDVNVWPLYGQQKVSGNIDGPLFPVNMMPLFIGGIGSDNGQTGSAPSGTPKVGTVAAAAAGATSLTYTLSSGAAPIVTDVFQIGSATLGSGAGLIAGSQNVVVTGVAGTASPYTLTVAALKYKVDTTGNGAAGLSAKNVQAPFFHNVVETNTLPSFTIEKNLGNYQSEQYAGCRVNKLDVKLPATNADATLTADMIGASVAIMDSPTAVTVDQAAPFVFAEGSVSLFGQSLVTVTNVEFSIDNGIKDTFTVQAQHTPQYVTPTSRTVAGKFTLVFTSLDDATYGYFKQTIPSLGTPVQGAINLTLTHPAAAGSLSISLPQTNIAKYTDDIKVGDVIMSNLEFTGSYQFSSASSLSAVLGNSVSTAY